MSLHPEHLRFSYPTPEPEPIRTAPIRSTPKNDYVDRLKCRHCAHPGRFVRTRYFPGGESDVYECANRACASLDLIWHVDRKVPLTYYDACEIARNRAREAGFLGLAGAFQQLMRKEHP